MQQVYTVTELLSLCEKVKSFNKSNLGLHLIKLLCSEKQSQQSGITFMSECDNAGQGGSRIWCCHITNGVMSYDLDFATFADDLESDNDDVCIDVLKK